MADLKMTTLPTPRIDVPIGRTDASGNVYMSANFLRQFLNSIIARVGGVSAPSLSDVADAVVADEAEIDALQIRVAALEDAVSALDGRLTAIEGRVTILESTLSEASDSSDALIAVTGQTRALLQRLARNVEDLQSGPRA